MTLRWIYLFGTYLSLTTASYCWLRYWFNKIFLFISVVLLDFENIGFIFTCPKEILGVGCWTSDCKNWPWGNSWKFLRTFWLFRSANDEIIIIFSPTFDHQRMSKVRLLLHLNLLRPLKYLNWLIQYCTCLLRVEDLCQYYYEWMIFDLCSYWALRPHFRV